LQTTIAYAVFFNFLARESWPKEGSCEVKIFHLHLIRGLEADRRPLIRGWIGCSLPHVGSSKSDIDPGREQQGPTQRDRSSARASKRGMLEACSPKSTEKPICVDGAIMTAAMAR